MMTFIWFKEKLTFSGLTSLIVNEKVFVALVIESIQRYYRIVE